MGIGDVRRTGENRTWTAHPAEQTDPSPHRDQRESRRDGESASNGEFVNTLLDINDLTIRVSQVSSDGTTIDTFSYTKTGWHDWESLGGP